ncbi:ubiquinone/menaquinone biosynthesis methyltransferase [bacterium]|nr:ubiquinone/menaquinone biosynthesis methyltransferase [bacterium]
MSEGLKKIYPHLAPTYELINHLLTLGLDIRWRKKAVQEAARTKGHLWLDMCSGTGEMAQLLSQKAPKGVSIISSDFCLPMLQRAFHKKYSSLVYFALSQANQLPFPDNSLDLITISFATRNLSPSRTLLNAHFQEIYRILKPGGRLVNLETSQPSSWSIRRLFHFYIRLTVIPIGTFLSGSKPGYKYLSSSIPRFYSPDEFQAVLYQQGFKRVKYKSFFWGTTALHIAEK